MKTLPTLEIATFELTLPSTKEKVVYRPFVVKEQKQLLMALNSDAAEQVRIVKDLVAVCTFGKLDVERLANFDLEYIFLKIRSKSIGEVVQLVLKCGNCEHEQDFSLNIDDVEVEGDTNHTNKIRLSEDSGIEMKYPSFEEINYLQANFTVENIFLSICKCVKSIYIGEDYYDASETEFSEIEKFIESLTVEQFSLLEQFFATMPKLRKVVEYECEKCGTKNLVELEGLPSFFA